MTDSIVGKRHEPSSTVGDILRSSPDCYSLIDSSIFLFNQLGDTNKHCVSLTCSIDLSFPSDFFGVFSVRPLLLFYLNK